MKEGGGRQEASPSHDERWEGPGKRRKSWPERRWGASSGSRGREKKAQAAMGEQRRGEVRRQAGLGRAGSTWGEEVRK